MNIRKQSTFLSLLIATIALLGLSLLPMIVRGEEPPPSFGEDMQGDTESDKVADESAVAPPPVIDPNSLDDSGMVTEDDGIAAIGNESCTEYIQNGGFEGNYGWSFQGNADYDSQFHQNGIRSGYISTYLRGDNEYSYMWQKITIPANYDRITIQFDTMAYSGDYGDGVHLAIYDETFHNGLDYGGLPYRETYSWRTIKAEPEVWLGGRTINLLFYITHDNDNYYSGVIFDNVSMKICTNGTNPQPTLVPTNTPYFVPPTPTNPPSTATNLKVRTLEFSQSIQNSNASVPMVANRAAIARAYFDIENASVVSSVTARLHAWRNGRELGNSPIAPFNPNGEITAISSPTRRDFNHSLNFQLPLDWTQVGQTTFWVEVNPNRTVSEGNYNDNRSQNFNITFHDVAPLDIVFIPIAYQRNGQGPVYRPDINASNNFGMGMLQKIFPVSLVRPRPHSEYFFRGDLKSYNGWNRLLQEIQSLRDREQRSGRRGASVMPKYYGLLHREAQSSDNIAGLAYVPGTTGIGIIDYNFITPHELGHNFGLQHVGCGGAQGIDPNYPYSNGKIGSVGLDVIDKNLVSESVYHDVMSYCGPRWISDYHYNRVFSVLVAALGQNVQRQNVQRRGAVQTQENGLLISGRIYPDGSGELNSAEPIVSSSLVQQPSSGAYQLDIVNRSGQTQFTYSFDPSRIVQESDDLPPSDFSFIVPQFNDLDRIQLRQGTNILATLLATIAEPELAVVQPLMSEGSDEISLSWQMGGVNARRAMADDPKVNVRYSQNGTDWTYLAVGLSSTEFDLSRTQLPASENGMIELVAVDRNMASTSQIPVGRVENKAPHVGIVSHQNNNFYTGEPIMLESIAMDMEDGSIAPHNLVWTSPELGTLGTGNTWIYTPQLSPGTYTIRLTATDSAGGQAQDAVQIVVQANGQKVYLPFVSK